MFTGIIEDIGTVIGPGGKQIRAIIDASGAEIDIQDNGVVTITSNDQEGAENVGCGHACMPGCGCADRTWDQRDLSEVR